MLHIKLGYTFTQSPSQGPQLENSLFDLLWAIHSGGSLAKAATVLGLSYRHVWGEVRKWENELGAELIRWERGKPARLSSFGDKLLYAEQRFKMRLMPEISNLVSEMEREFALAFDRSTHVISMYASHDLALPRLKDFLAQHAKLHLDLQFRGSVDALQALSRGECAMAGFHVGEDREPGTVTQRTFKKLLRPGKHKLISFVTREQGLIVAAGNPKRIRGAQDLRRKDVRFVNRQAGSGTRVEIDQLLLRNQIRPEQVNGYEDEEPTHSAVAAAVAFNRADVGIGIRAAAAHFGLDFIPLLREQYYFACLKERLQDEAVTRLIDLLAGVEWRSLVADLPGYDPGNAGRIVSLKQALPWYRFPTPREEHHGTVLSHAI